MSNFDYEKFNALLEKANQGDAEAQAEVGRAYLNGEGVRKNFAEAVAWFKKAVQKGNAVAQNGLGVCYYNGEGVTRDFVQAVKWFRKAAEQGNANAQCSLANRYYNGEGVTKDFTQAVEWYRKSAEQGVVLLHKRQGRDKRLCASGSMVQKGG